MMKLKSEKDYIEAYKKTGYTSGYRLNDGHLQDLETKEQFSADDIQILAEHRFEGRSNPSDMSILYVLEVPGKSEGTVLVSYGSAHETSLAEFFTAVPKDNISQKANILMDGS